MASNKNTSVDLSLRTFGRWLRQLREARGLPIRAVAAAAKMDQAHLSKVELGQRLPTAKQTFAIAKFFKIDPTQMDARRIAEKFCTEYAGNPAAAEALVILNSTPFKRRRQ